MGEGRDRGGGGGGARRLPFFSTPTLPPLTLLPFLLSSSPRPFLLCAPFTPRHNHVCNISQPLPACRHCWIMGTLVRSGWREESAGGLWEDNEHPSTWRALTGCVSTSPHPLWCWRFRLGRRETMRAPSCLIMPVMTTALGRDNARQSEPPNLRYPPSTSSSFARMCSKEDVDYGNNVSSEGREQCRMEWVWKINFHQNADGDKHQLWANE